MKETKEVKKEVTKKVVKKVTEKVSSKIAKGAFYYGGTHFKKGDSVSLKKEDMDFLDGKGKLE